MSESKSIENKSVFDVLSSIDVSDKIKEKNGLKYLPWAAAWAEIKKKYPNATYKVYPQIIDDGGNTRFWHDDGHTGWVEVGVTIEGQEMIETLSVMNFKNQAVAADQITSVDANKSMKRCLVKACALHGLGIYIYMNEDVPEDVSKSMELKEKIKNLVDKKVALSDKAKAIVKELCVAAEKQANPEFGDDLISGNYKNIDDVEILTNLEKQLLAVRK